MKSFENWFCNIEDKIICHLWWFLALLLPALIVGCGSGGGNAILGGTGVLPSSQIVAGASGVVAPGVACPIAALTIPTVTSVDPANGYLLATTSTAGVANSGKNIYATFSLPMNSATINSASFTLTQVGVAGPVPALINYVAATSVATLSTTAALLTSTYYNVNISTAVASNTGVGMSCVYAWSFETAAAPSVGVASVNLGTAAPYAIAAAAGVTNTAVLPMTHINGNVVLGAPTPTCNAATVGAADAPGFGACGGFAPTINGIVITPTYPDTTTDATVMADLRTAYNSIMSASLPGAIVLGASVIGTGGSAGACVGCAGNATLPPGVYISNTGSSIGITGNLTLDGQGDVNAKFVFQMPSSTLTTAAGALGVPGSQIILINGTKASNVWWQVGSSATLGTYSVFQGNILADTSITMGTNATSCGRLLAGAVTATGAFTFDSNVVSVPGNAFAPACK